MINRTLRSAVWSDKLAFFDDEANPRDMTSWKGRFKMYGPLGADSPVTIDSTSTSIVTVSQPTITFELAAGTVTSAGAYVYSLHYIDAAGKEHVGKRDTVYFE